jgi:uncharacterized membrane protein
MVDQATQHITISAPPERCFAVATEFEKYPEWAKDVKEAMVLTRDTEGRATQVEYRTSALGRSTHYTLAYDYSAAPAAMSWRMVSGDIMRTLDGFYRFEPSTAEPGGTDVTYDLSVELVVPLPGFVKRRAEVRILNSVRELKSRVEQG